MENKIYYCENCGGVMEFDVESQSLKYPNCDTAVPILNEKERIVEHSLTRHAMQTVRAEERRPRPWSAGAVGPGLRWIPQARR